MDLRKTIEDLQRDAEKLEPIIASFEELRAVAVPEQKRRGRKPLSPEERREVSARAKKYWASRLASR
jgi:hypothetical protein